jgi:hypothetical protein
MITLPSAGVLLVAGASALVLMTCQWIIGGMWMRNRRVPQHRNGDRARRGPSSTKRHRLDYEGRGLSTFPAAAARC